LRACLLCLPLVFALTDCSSSKSGSPAGSNGGNGSASDAGPGGAGPKLNLGFDWNGVVGTGQSLSVGSTPITTTSQPYNNLKLSLGSVTVPPWDPNNATFSLVPLVEPIRPIGSGYPRPYPGNIWGETPHSAMGNQITALVKAASPDKDYITVHTVVGESGQGMVALKKQTAVDGGAGGAGATDATTGNTGRAYAATLFEASAITRLAQAAGKTYGIGAIVMTHGETDSGSSTYKDELVQLLADYNAELSAITGQTQKIPMYLSQQHAYPNTAANKGQRPVANQVQWQLGVDHKDDFVCVGPQYQYQGNANKDGVHLSTLGYQMLGEKNAQVYYERVVLGHDWQPLQPTTVERNGRVVTVHFNVPVPPLNWDETLDAPAITEWVNGRGFELSYGGVAVAIDSVAINGDAVDITAAADLSAGVVVAYAMADQGVQLKAASYSVRWGQLRDSDPFVGLTSAQANPNYCVSFQISVP
jgi:hypothetical protein